MNEREGTDKREFYEKFHARQEFPWISRTMQSERLRVLTSMIEKNVTKDASMRKTLLVGCGSGDDMSLDPSAFGMDLSLQSLQNTKIRFSSSRVTQGDAHTLPYKNNTFDLIICSEVIEHLPHRDRFIAEANRVLGEGGILILTTPNWKSWYGLARKGAEALSRKAVTAAGQPIDNWSTLTSLEGEIESGLTIMEERGIWFYPPMGKGHVVLPFPFSAVVYYLLLPLERISQKLLPSWGHMIAIAARTGAQRRAGQ